jgi:2-polyprenyl-6-methoxyphenol hydroxylase-like FAD-dependent oxidoreductase
VHRKEIEQFGIAYCDIVNSVRAQMPPQVVFIQARVEAINADSKCPSVALADGSRLNCRLVVVATGMLGQMPERLGLTKTIIKEELSMAFGFMLERTDGQPFAFDAVTFHPGSTAAQIGYLTLFRMGQYMRGNMFAYWGPREPDTREMLRTPMAFLDRAMPGLEAVIGRFGVAGKVEVFKIDLYRMGNCCLPGVVLLGDAYQSVCPSTGMGLTKVLTDVDVLCNECLPGWLAAGEIGAQQTAAYYAHPRKTPVDDRAVRLALAGRDAVLDNSLHWRLRRRIRALRFANGW